MTDTATPLGFRVLVALTGRAFLVIGFFARFPLAMLTVGIASFVTDMRAPELGKAAIADGGLVAAAVGIGTAIGAPIGGAIADKRGQLPVLLAGAIGSPALVIALIVLTLQGAPLLAIQTVGFFAGALAPQISAMARARWFALTQSLAPVARQAQRNKAFGYESMVDELGFVFGPVIVGVLAATGLLWLPLALAAVVSFAFTLLFALHRTTALAAAVHADSDVGYARKRSVFLGPSMIIAAAMFFAGVFFGTTLTGTLEFARIELGQASLGSLLYGVMGVTSALSAILSSRLPASVSLLRRWFVFSTIMLLGTAVLPFVNSLPLLVIALLVMGAGQGASLVAYFGVGAQLAPHGRVSLVMTFLGTMVVVGQALATAVAGQLVKATSYHSSYLLTIVAVVALIALGVAVRRPARAAASEHHA
ncbi:MFS transporter [Micrococcales bacterium 31B]|nr:MFS transporter [Micrococcales bacterium 31B]